jgi:hypothetical protein
VRLRGRAGCAVAKGRVLHTGPCAQRGPRSLRCAPAQTTPVCQACPCWPRATAGRRQVPSHTHRQQTPASRTHVPGRALVPSRSSAGRPPQPLAGARCARRYVLQMDDDSWVLESVGYNLVELFRHKGFLLGAQRQYRDPPTVTWGLPEVGARNAPCADCCAACAALAGPGVFKRDRSPGRSVSAVGPLLPGDPQDPAHHALPVLRPAQHGGPLLQLWRRQCLGDRAQARGKERAGGHSWPQAELAARGLRFAGFAAVATAAGPPPPSCSAPQGRHHGAGDIAWLRT